jgi:hypothetical protein
MNSASAWRRGGFAVLAAIAIGMTTTACGPAVAADTAVNSAPAGAVHGRRVLGRSGSKAARRCSGARADRHLADLPQHGRGVLEGRCHPPGSKMTRAGSVH